MPWLVAVALITLVLLEVPNLLAYGQEAEGFVFTGVLWWAYDFAQYAAAMREGATGPSWLIHDHLTGEPHSPVFMYPLYVAIGKLAALLAVDPLQLYRVVGVLTRATLLGAFYALCAAIFRPVGTRRLAFVLMVFSSGLGVWLLLFGPLIPSGVIDDASWTLAIDMRAPEVTTFLLFFAAPHLMLGLALQLLAGFSYIRSWYNPSRRSPLFVAVATFGVGLANPFGLVTLCTALIAHLSVMSLRQRGIATAPLLGVIAAVAAAVPFFTYSLLVFGADPFWGAVYGQQNETFSPPPLLLGLGLAPVLVLGLIGLRGFLWRQTAGRTLVILWILVTLVLMYAPVSFQRRFAPGLQPMLALIATLGLASVWRAWREGAAIKAWFHRFGTAACVLMLFSSTVATYVIVLRVATRPSQSVEWAGTFQPATLLEAGQWLAAVMGPDDVLLGEPITGNYLAGVGPGRAFVGHEIATLDYELKKQETRRFFHDESFDARREFLAAHNIRYVIYGPHERATGALPPTEEYLKLSYVIPDVSIFEVEAASRGER